MNDEQRRLAGEYELENGHERKQRLRSERMRKWRKAARRPGAYDFDDRAQFPLTRRFAP